ncbi:hypothetical protein J1N35_044799 [Gossypium stocksii]|uniref:Uncharacterized protein n=1 Tax=Gossypium stocksii TaxID=47602 RepID=A0A9D3UA26_9ROSI|nr:hypothetical protein J1N35_044799 [Gossypium stocksii]
MGVVATTIYTSPSEQPLYVPISDKSMLDAKVPLIMYATVEIHESDQVIRQFSGLFGVHALV